MFNQLEGVVLRIERNSIHDGQGLRTVLFLKGCPLSCQWCSTPESQQSVIEKGYNTSRCVGCGTCVQHCPEKALSLVDNKVFTDPSRCKSCLTCVAVCPQDAHKGYGEIMTVEQAVEEINKDEIFFFHSGGGVTLSGGECLQQSDFTAGVLKGCRLNGIDTAVETSLHSSWQNVEKILPYVNTLYVDLKHYDSTEHKKLVGVGNELLLDNIQKLDRSEYPFTLCLRIPLIPGINDDDENLRSSLEFCSTLSKLKEVEILPYHRLGAETYAHLGRNYQLEQVGTPSKEYILERTEFLRNQQITVPVKIGGGFI